MAHSILIGRDRIQPDLLGRRANVFAESGRNASQIRQTARAIGPILRRAFGRMFERRMVDAYRGLPR